MFISKYLRFSFPHCIVFLFKESKIWANTMFPRFIGFSNTFKKKKKKSANNNFKLSMQLSPEIHLEQFVQMYSRAVVSGVLGVL